MENKNFIKEYVDDILKHVNVEAIRDMNFSVAVDMINASACAVDPYLFEKLNIKYVGLNDIPNGKFGHTPEPIKENLKDISNLVKSGTFDIGFAQDPDADRLVVIDESGNILSEEYTLALGVEAVCSQNKNSAVVVNMSTSQMNTDIAEKYGGKCIRTKVGEANVVEGMVIHNATIGGEGSGGIIYPKINFARDSFVSMILILDLMATRNQKISEIIETLPHYVMRKDKMELGMDLALLYEKIKSHFSDAQINELDGLRLDFADKSWVHLRPSNTEPIVRLYGEATSQQKVDELFSEVKDLF